MFLQKLQIVNGDFVIVVAPQSMPGESMQLKKSSRVKNTLHASGAFDEFLAALANFDCGGRPTKMREITGFEAFEVKTADGWRYAKYKAPVKIGNGFDEVQFTGMHQSDFFTFEAPHRRPDETPAEGFRADLLSALWSAWLTLSETLEKKWNEIVTDPQLDLFSQIEDDH